MIAEPHLLVGSHARATPDGSIAFTLRAPPGALCSVTLRSARQIPSRWLGRAPRRVRLGTRTFTMPAAGEATVTIRLSAEHLALLRRMQWLRAVVRATATDDTGQVTCTGRPVILHAPPRECDSPR
jgi:hypothetical protein